MPTSPARTADDIADNIRSLIDRVVDAKLTQEMAKRGQDVADVLAERGAEVGELAAEAWRESKPMRRDAARRAAKAGGEAARWSDQAWRKSVRPLIRDLWRQRTVAIGAAGAAVPVGRELVDTAAERLGIRQRREERHWGAFFLGLLFGAAAGAIVALLTAPKRGEEMRRELTERADEIAARARDEWVPLFQGGETNGHSPAAADAVSDAGDALHDAAAEAGAASGEAASGEAASGEAAEQAADDTAEAINESFDPVDRGSPTA